MNWELIWEAIKQPLRQGLLALYSFLINKAFEFIIERIGFEFTPEQKTQILGYGVTIVYAILSALDRFLHKLGKAKSTKRVKSPLITGIARF